MGDQFLTWVVLALGVCGIGILMWGFRIRKKVSSHLLLPPRIIRVSHCLRILYFSIALFSLFFLLAMPSSLGLEKTRTAHIVYAVDVSRSMAAEDPLGTANRIERSEHIMKEICFRYPNVHAALYGFTRLVRSHVYFSDRKEGLSDCAYIVNTIENVLGVESVGRQGSNIARAILVGAGAFPLESKSRVLILFTDGEYTDGEAEFVQAFSEVRAKNVKLFLVGVGEEKGALIPIYDSLSGKVIDVERHSDTQKPVVTALRSDVLRSIAVETGGVYFHEDEQEKLFSAVESLFVEEEQLFREFYSQWKFIPLAMFVIASILFLKRVI